MPAPTRRSTRPASCRALHVSDRSGRGYAAQVGRIPPLLLAACVLAGCGSSHKLVGGVEPVLLIRHFMQRELAELLSNPELPAALEARLKQQRIGHHRLAFDRR